MLLHVGKSKRSETEYYAKQIQKIRSDIYTMAEIKMYLISENKRHYQVSKISVYVCMYVCMCILCMYVYVCVY
jgi:hypothetical protein